MRPPYDNRVAPPPSEIWNSIPGCPKYEVSDCGNVRSWKSGSPEFLKPRPNNKRGRYLMVTMWVDGKIKALTVHRAVMLAFVGPRPEGLQIRHLNGDPSDNRLVNLSYGSALENAADTIRLGRSNNAFTFATHCIAGHPLSGDNLYLYPTKTRKGIGRGCRICRKESARKANERKKEKRAERRTSNPPGSRTHCIRGHELTPENTERRSDGGRACRVCRRDQGRENVRRRRERLKGLIDD